VRHINDNLKVRFSTKAGSHVLSVSFVSTLSDPDGILQPARAYSSIITDVDEAQDGVAAVDVITVEGPYNPAGAGETPSRQKIFSCRPRTGTSDEVCATKILSTLARGAFRRPITPADVQVLLGFYRTGRSRGGFEEGIQSALERLLVDPEFLFRVERRPERVPSGGVYAISDLELASRLSFLLWSSVPDDELLDAASRGKLATPAVLEQHVRRMLTDKRSNALVENFVGQWLGVRDLKNREAAEEVFQSFDVNLRNAFQTETELFVESQLRDDRPITELLTANYTFLNERLALHYEVPNVWGNYFRRVTFDEGNSRGGLLGQGSLLMVTSYVNRTSPVLRGKWVLDTLLGAPPPPPPPNVPTLPEQRRNAAPTSVRDRLEQHRQNPVCASCHSLMDPWGFAFENFDATGAWRWEEGGAVIDATAKLPDGTAIDGIQGLRKLLMNRRDQYVDALTGRLLAYALGRSLDHDDYPVVRDIRRQAALKGYRWSAILVGVATSAPFRMRQADPSSAAVASAGR
jgi:hypothetical protein